MPDLTHKSYHLRLSWPLWDALFKLAKEKGEPVSTVMRTGLWKHVREDVKE